MPITKPIRLYSTSGTLAGAPVAFDLQSLAGDGYTSTYAEIHNLDPSNTFSCTIDSSVFRIPAGRALLLPAFVNQFTLNGTGLYTILSGDNPAVVDTQVSLPSLTSTAQVGNSIPLPNVDNITLEATTDLHVKAAGLTRPLVNTGIGVEVGQGGQFTLGSMAGLDFAVGETVTITVTGGTSETYTARVAAASPNEFTIGAGPGPGQSLQNLAVKVAALQSDVDSAQNGIEDFISFWTADYSGAALTVSDTSVNVSSFGPLVTDRLPGRVVTQLIRRTVVASDVTRNAIWLGLPIGVTVLDALVQWRDNVGLAKAWDGTISPSGNNVFLTPGATPWVATDVLTVLVQYTLP